MNWFAIWYDWPVLPLAAPRRAFGPSSSKMFATKYWLSVVMAQRAQDLPFLPETLRDGLVALLLASQPEPMDDVAAMRRAVYSNNGELVRRVAARSVCAVDVPFQGMSLLERALDTGALRAAEALLDCGATFGDALCYCHNLASVQLLERRGYDLASHPTALDRHAAKGNKEIVARLIQAGAVVSRVARRTAQARGWQDTSVLLEREWTRRCNRCRMAFAQALKAVDLYRFGEARGRVLAFLEVDELEE
jgi:hypothetical protein